MILENQQANSAATSQVLIAEILSDRYQTPKMSHLDPNLDAKKNKKNQSSTGLFPLAVSIKPLI